MNENAYQEIVSYCKANRVELVAVSKTKSADEILKVYDSGQKAFGENKVQEMISKQPFLPNDIQWSLIGHLQTNKVKPVVAFVSLIQSVDSLKLLAEINRQAQKINRILPVLLQIHIAEEETKFGLSFSEATDLFRGKSIPEMKNILIRGMMGIATFTSDEEQIRHEFRGLKTFFDDCRKYQAFNIQPEILSMGMSTDYKMAVEEGSNMVRIGSAIFGERN